MSPWKIYLISSLVLTAVILIAILAIFIFIKSRSKGVLNNNFAKKVPKLNIQKHGSQVANLKKTIDLGNGLTVDGQVVQTTEKGGHLFTSNKKVALNLNIKQDGKCLGEVSMNLKDILVNEDIDDIDFGKIDNIHKIIEKDPKLEKIVPSIISINKQWRMLLPKSHSLISSFDKNNNSHIYENEPKLKEIYELLDQSQNALQNLLDDSKNNDSAFAKIQDLLNILDVSRMKKEDPMQIHSSYSNHQEYALYTRDIKINPEQKNLSSTPNTLSLENTIKDIKYAKVLLDSIFGNDDKDSTTIDILQNRALKTEAIKLIENISIISSIIEIMTGEYICKNIFQNGIGEIFNSLMQDIIQIGDPKSNTDIKIKISPENSDDMIGSMNGRTRSHNNRLSHTLYYKDKNADTQFVTSHTGIIKGKALLTENWPTDDIPNIERWKLKKEQSYTNRHAIDKPTLILNCGIDRSASDLGTLNNMNKQLEKLMPSLTDIDKNATTLLATDTQSTNSSLDSDDIGEGYAVE